MKKLTLLFVTLLCLGFMFQACDDTKTYAEQLEDEDNAIKDFISKNNIKVLSLADFEAKGNTTDLKTNEYVALSGGVYMQIVDKGTGDSIKNNDIVLVRFMEYDIMSQDTTSVSNYDVDGWVDEFRYSLSGTTASGLFTYGSMLTAYGTAVPSGWLLALKYVTDYAHVKLIVPSKMGHDASLRYVYPYFYDIRKFQIYK